MIDLRLEHEEEVNESPPLLKRHHPLVSVGKQKLKATLEC